MEQKDLESLLNDIAQGDITPQEAMKRLRCMPYTDLGFAKVDHHRGIRQGISEVIYGAGKTPDQIACIAADMIRAGQKNVFITRLNPTSAHKLKALLAKSVLADKAQDTTQDPIAFAYYDVPQMAVLGDPPTINNKGTIVVACGGTSDIPVAEEAALTAEMLGNHVQRLFDVGVAGLHRLLAQSEKLIDARVIIAVAGMEGALPSVISGMVSCPVIAVPTSVGYGASFEGVAALLAMLNSCASGVSVVNIDNGFGAAYQAHLINSVPHR